MVAAAFEWAVTTGIERAFRADAPRILGAVARYTGDLMLAEDAVQEAFARALAEAAAGREPANPAAWITTVARRIVVDMVRRDRTALRAVPALAAELALAPREEGEMRAEEVFTGDERLELILLVCHPDVSEEARVALALRFVCGVPTARIAEVFLVQEADDGRAPHAREAPHPRVAHPVLRPTIRPSSPAGSRMR